MKEVNDNIRLGSWKPARIASLEKHLEANSVRIGNRLFLMGGYQSLTQMCQKMQIFDIKTGTWNYGPELPQGFPHSHAGVASYGRFIFVVAGQPGPACEPATNRGWVLPLDTMVWEPLAPLPAARYCPILQYLDGNLHLITGTNEDRETISKDHFILEVGQKDAKAPPTLIPLENQVWRIGPPIPEGGDHAGSIVCDGKIYVIGGEHGHPPMTMDVSKCRGTYWPHKYLFRFDPKKEEWERLADMPFASSHFESQILVLDNRIIVFGGTGKDDILLDWVQEYDPARNRWRQLKRLPIPRKGGVVWDNDDTLFINGGQIFPNKRNLDERSIISETMAAKIKRGSRFDIF